MKKINNKGFSLVEIIAAIAILAVLMTIATNAYNIYKRKARQQAYDTMAKSAAYATEDYLMENAQEKYIAFEKLKEMEYLDTLQDPRYKNEKCTGIVINKVIQGTNQKQLDTLFQKVKICCKNYKYQYDYTGDKVKVTKIDSCEYIDGDEIAGVYKLIFKPQGGSICDPKTIVKQEGEEWGPLCVTTRTKYVFKGWNTNKNGSGSTIKESTKVGKKDINAYAIWNPIYTLTFDPDGGTACTPSSIDKEKGEKWETLCSTSRAGYAFKGWKTEKNGKGSTVTKNSIAQKNMTIYAEWNPYYTITFDSKGGSACNPASIKKEKGEKWGTLCTPTRPGYVFKEWNTKADGRGNTITSNTTVMANITAYAIWNPLYTLTYNSNGGSGCNPASITKEKGEKWGTLCTPSRTGYTFQGWKNDSTTITEDSICNSNLTVTAKWQANSYTLRYDNNGGSGCSTKTGAYDSGWGELCTPSRAGYTFQGWKSGSNTITSSTICKGDLTVAASWKLAYHCGTIGGTLQNDPSKGYICVTDKIEVDGMCTETYMGECTREITTTCLGSQYVGSGTSTSNCRTKWAWTWYCATGYNGAGCYRNKEYECPGTETYDCEKTREVNCKKDGCPSGFSWYVVNSSCYRAADLS